MALADLGWPVCPGAHPLAEGPRACSCDRVGCPAPGAHPLSPAWAVQATTDKDQLRRWWTAEPYASVVVSTGSVVDVLDVPAEAGITALARAGRSRIAVGPVAAYGAERYLFFIATRGSPHGEEEWWPCHLDVTEARTESEPDTPELRWHCRNSYVLVPPSTLVSGGEVWWVRRPRGRSLPDSLALLEVLTDACDELARTSPVGDPHRRR